MVTGIETAGLVLGAFPLMIELVRTCLDTTGQKKLRKAWIRTLRVEACIFKDTCTGLLGRLVPPEHVARLLDGVGWDDPKLRDLLNDCIGIEAAETFIESVTDLKSALDDLRKMLGLDEDMKVCRQYATPRLPWTEIFPVARQPAKSLGQIQTRLQKGFTWKYL